MSAATLLSVPVSETTAMQSENVSLSEMKSEVLIRNITDSLNSAVVATLKELEPYIREVWRRLDAGEAIQVRGGDGRTVTCDTRKTFCTLVLGKTYRAVH